MNQIYKKKLIYMGKLTEEEKNVWRLSSKFYSWEQSGGDDQAGQSSGGS